MSIGEFSEKYNFNQVVFVGRWKRTIRFLDIISIFPTPVLVYVNQNEIVGFSRVVKYGHHAN